MEYGCFGPKGLHLLMNRWQWSGHVVLVVLVLAWILGARVYVVRSGSMLPSLAPGSLVMTLPADYDNVQVGSIICFDRGGQLVAHRVKAIRGYGLVTQGDNNSSLDPGTVGREDLKGRVVTVIPGIGWPILLIRAFPLVFGGLVALVFAVRFACHSRSCHKTIG